MKKPSLQGRGSTHTDKGSFTILEQMCGLKTQESSVVFSKTTKNTHAQRTCDIRVSSTNNLTYRYVTPLFVVVRTFGPR